MLLFICIYVVALYLKFSQRLDERAAPHTIWLNYILRVSCAFSSLCLLTCIIILQWSCWSFIPDCFSPMTFHALTPKLQPHCLVLHKVIINYIIVVHEKYYKSSHKIFSFLDYMLHMYICVYLINYVVLVLCILCI